MTQCEDIKNLFKEGVGESFDFSLGPMLIKSKKNHTLERKEFKEEDLSRWARAQRSLLRWANDDKVFTKEFIESTMMGYNLYFKNRGPLRGNVLDIGGGWGLYRQWWKPGESDVFIVHDPGVERFVRGPHKYHHHYYQRAFSLPMTFVEGFGEDLPYQNDLFDTCLIASMLPHCLGPERVLAEAYRCLRQGGTILIIQACHSARAEFQHANIFNRLLKHIHHPRKLLSLFYNRLFGHTFGLRHFINDDIVKLLEEGGYSKVCTSNIPTINNYYAFEATKELIDTA